jgi:AraC-like DNA-binding protein
VKNVMKKPEVLERQCAEMKAKRGIVAKPPGSADTLNETKYKIKEAATVFGCSTWTVRRMFKAEKGIIPIGKDPYSKRRRFVIPESVLMRVYRSRAA